MPVPPPLRALLWAAAAAAALWAFGRAWPLLWSVCWPFALAGGLAMLVERPVQWLVGRGVSRTAASAVCLLLALAATAGAAAWAGVTAWSELGHLRGHLPALYAALASALAHANRSASDAGSGLPPGLRALLMREMAKGYDAAGPLLQQALTRLQHIAAALPGGIFGFFVALAGAFFLSRDRPRVAAWVASRDSAGAAGRIRVVTTALRESVWGLIRAQLLLALATFVISLIGLAIIGAPYAFLASLAAAVFDLLPILGPAMVYVPWILGMALYHMTGAALGLTAVLCAVGIVRWTLTPHLLGSQVGLHPLVALGAMYVGQRLAGVTGLVLGPLAAALALAVWSARPPTGAGRRPAPRGRRSGPSAAAQ